MNKLSILSKTPNSQLDFRAILNMKRSLIYFMSLILISSSCTQGFSPPETSLFDPNLKDLYPLTSLLPPNPRGVLVLAVDLDGTMYLVEPLSRNVLWSFSSGGPTYSSYQASRNVSDSELDYFIDIDDDWNLYNRSRFGNVKLCENAEQFLGRIPFASKNGVTVGLKKTSLILVDAQSGELLNSYGNDDSSPSSSLVLKSAEDNALLLMDNDNKLAGSATVDVEKVRHRLYIKRTDYEINHFSFSKKLLWNVTFSEFIVDYSGDIELPYSPIFVHRIRGSSLPEFLSLLHTHMVSNSHHGESVLSLPGPKYLLPEPGDTLSVIGTAGGLLSLPASSSPFGKPLESLITEDSIRNTHPGGIDLSLPVGKPHLAAINQVHAAINQVQAATFNSGSGQVPPLASPDMENSWIRFSFDKFVENIWYYAAFLFFPAVVVGVFCRNLAGRKQGDDKVLSTIHKKKKTRRSGNNKNNTHNGKRQEKLSSDNKFGDISEFPVIEGNARNSLRDFTGLVDGLVDGRKIGKLLLSNKEIAKGSNGTIILEGIYNGRRAAVKRLVRTHYDVALKEIQNLIASDQHPNIVRWHGVEYDQDFVYLSLERCTCNLNDFICIFSESSEGPIVIRDQNPGVLNDHLIQLQARRENNKHVELWKANGYPSPLLLKLMRDVVYGLSHLHELGIIHRDLKPQNVLIASERSLCAKLSDMGISKQLTGDMSSLTLHATGCGSSGWQAPEQLLLGRQTRAVDLFSLGCVLFFCLTGGKHPYGESIERDVNIVNNNKDLFLVESIPEACDLFSHLLDPDPNIRPKAVDVLHHPLFWSSETRLSFLRDVSDRVELEDRENESELLAALESIAPVALNGKWDEKMENAFLINIGKYRRYRFDSIRDLLRVIRNKSNHYRELPQEIQHILGQVPEGFVNYFSSRFPRLLIEVYKVMYSYCKEEEFFSKFTASNLV